MDIYERTDSGIVVIGLKGRFDTLSAREFQTKVVRTAQSSRAVCLDFEEVTYLSSVGIGVLVELRAKLERPELLALVSLSEFVSDVLRVTNVAGLFHVYPNRPQAMRTLQELLRRAERPKLEEETTACGVFTTYAGADAPGSLRVTGDLADVLHARLTTESLVDQRTSGDEYSIGVGAMGESVDDCAPFLGEMMTVGGPWPGCPRMARTRPTFCCPTEIANRSACARSTASRLADRSASTAALSRPSLAAPRWAPCSSGLWSAAGEGGRTRPA